VPNDIVRLKLRYGQYSDETLVYFNPFATSNYDPKYDVQKMFASHQDVPEIYTVTPGGDMLCMNLISETPAEIPINISSFVEGEMSITAFDYETLAPTVDIFLEDKSNGTMNNLREISTYTFTAYEGQNSERFVLHLVGKLGIGDPQAETSINIFSADGKLYVTSEESTEGELSVMNMAGQMIWNNRINSTGMSKLELNVPAGYYLVRFVTDSDVITEKIFLN
jgi:hypothetical protein